MENESVTFPEIEAAGVIPDTDQQFSLILTHRGDQIESITLDID